MVLIIVACSKEETKTCGCNVFGEVVREGTTFYLDYASPINCKDIESTFRFQSILVNKNEVTLSDKECF